MTPNSYLRTDSSLVRVGIAAFAVSLVLGLSLAAFGPLRAFAQSNTGGATTQSDTYTAPSVTTPPSTTNVTLDTTPTPTNSVTNVTTTSDSFAGLSRNSWALLVVIVIAVALVIVGWGMGNGAPSSTVRLR